MKLIEAECEINDLAEYTDFVRKCAKEKPRVLLWFRGQRNEKWALAPSLLREPYVSTPEDIENSLTVLFASYGPAYCRDFPSAWIDRQVLMQHHNCPTRLLDWSESALTALYFAVAKLGKGEEGKDDNVPASVYVLDPRALAAVCEIESLRRGLSTAQMLRGSQAEGVFREGVHAPFPFIPSYIDARIAAQKGRFTLHGYAPEGLHGLPAKIVRRVRVPAAAKEELFWRLKECGITETTLFPDLDALARELRCHITSGEDVG